MASTTITSQQQKDILTGRLWSAGLVTTITTSIANLIIYLLGVAFLGVPGDSQVLQPASIIITSVVTGLGATGVLWAISKFSRHTTWLFRVVAVVFLLLSFGGPISAASGGMPGVMVNTQTALTMAAMHVVTAVLAVGILTGWSRRK